MHVVYMVNLHDIFKVQVVLKPYVGASRQFPPYLLRQPSPYPSRQCAPCPCSCVE